MGSAGALRKLTTHQFGLKVPCCTWFQLTVFHPQPRMINYPINVKDPRGKKNNFVGELVLVICRNCY